MASAAARAARTAGGDSGGDSGGSATGAGTSTGAPSALSPVAATASSDAAVNLALIEGSDATGATAAALQSAQAATAAPVSPLEVPATQNPVLPDATPGIVPGAGVVAAPAIAGSTSDRAAGGGGSSTSGGSSGSSAGADSGAAAALQQLTTNPATASSDTAPVSTLRVHASVDSAEFPQAVADRVSFMVDNSWSNAKLSVNPPQLGPIELQIAVQGDHAQVTMSTHSALTRDALESSVPKLREMLNSQGFTHVNVDVSQRSFQERSAYTPPYTWMPPAPSSPGAPAATAGPAAARAALGIVDAYA